jgi:hypothetical protein
MSYQVKPHSHLFSSVLTQPLLHAKLAVSHLDKARQRMQRKLPCPMDRSQLSPVSRALFIHSGITSKTNPNEFSERRFDISLRFGVYRVFVITTFTILALLLALAPFLPLLREILYNTVWNMNMGKCTF